jgi:hypothetical protein
VTIRSQIGAVQNWLKTQHKKKKKKKLTNKNTFEALEPLR